MKFRILSFCLILFIGIAHYSLFAQNSKIDSLQAVLKTEKDDTSKAITLNNLSRELYHKGESVQADSAAHRAVALSIALNFKPGAAMAYEIMGHIYDAQGKSTNAIKYYSLSLDFYNDIGNKKQAAKVSGNIGYVYYEQGKYPQALTIQLQTLKIVSEIGDTDGMGYAYNDIGDIYYAQGNFTEALKNQSEALKMYQETKNKRGMVNTYGDMGILYSGEGNYTDAITYHTLSLNLAKEINYKRGVGNACINLGDIYRMQGNYTQALSYEFQALQTDKEIDNKPGVAIAYANLGNIFTLQKKYQPANQYLDSALATAKEMERKEILSAVYNIKALLDSTSGNYKGSLGNYKKYIAYRDSLVNEENTKKMVQAEMNAKFEEEKEKTKAEQEKKDAIAKVDSNRKNILLLFIVFIALAVGVIAIIIFRSLRTTRAQKTLIELQKSAVEEQKHMVEEKNREILDSITYAKRLQDAILPPLSMVEKYLPESFILYKPKDIVAGDFYWVAPLPPEGGISGKTENPPSEGREAVLIAAADCTGHGVPGAMVSVVCSNALNRTVKEFKITEPGKILDKVRELVLETFEKSESNVQDGMDISIAAISYSPSANSTEVRWSGAYNSLWYIHKGEMKELPADKQPIGQVDRPIPFNTHTLKLQKGDTLYLFTDGYADQFGGPKGKKFKYKQFQEKLLAISHQPMAEQKKEMENILADWKGELEQVDDILIIGIRV
jgi:tetratricopeptide (TPR) repeat protein